VILEIRTYRLRPGTGEEFVRVMREESVPLLREAGLRVIACGPSLAGDGDEEEAYLMRAFDSLEQRERQEESFYSSDVWRHGPREAVVSRIESMHTIVVESADVAVAALEAQHGDGQNGIDRNGEE